MKRHKFYRTLFYAKIEKMNKIIYFLFVFFLLPVSASAAEQINSFDANLQIQENGNIAVTETIIYDFGDDDRHGIFRDIPLIYRADTSTTTYGLTISNISVTNESGGERPFIEQGDETYVRIRIGDPDVFVTGEQTYVIEYTVRGALLSHLADVDALRWDVTGNYWDVPIQNVTTQVQTPESVPITQFECFVGVQGGTETCTWEEMNSELVRYESSRALRAGEGMTIFAGFTKGVVATPIIEAPNIDLPPKSAQSGSGFVQDPVALMYGIVWLIGAPIIVFIIMFYLWYTRGRDPEGRVAIVPQYDPPEDLTPEEVGVVHDEYFENKDLIAAILGLASTGYIKIHHQKIDRKFFFDSEEYILEKTSTDRPGNKFRRELLDALFNTKYEEEFEIDGEKITGIPVKNLKKYFPKEYKKIQKSVYKEITQKGYFTANPQDVRNRYMIFAITLFVLVTVLAEILVAHSVLWISVIPSIIIIILFGRKMTARTKKGVLAKEYILGFKDFLKTAQKDRIAFHAGPESVKSQYREQTPQEFFDLLPYAIALGVEEEWAKQFEGITLEEPNWYTSGTPTHTFTAAAFVSEFNGFSTHTVQNMAPSSSGAGGAGGSFAGGGAGGGGGGSW